MEELPIPAPTPRVSKEVVKRFRVTADEEKLLEEKAMQAGLTFSEFCRRATLGGRLVEAVPSEVRREIYAVGNNLNQLARLAQAGKLPGVGVTELNNLISDLYAMLRS